MKPRLFAPPLAAAQQQRLRQGLRSANAFTARRCQILLASARGETPSQIARQLGCTAATVRNALRAFGREGLACLKAQPTTPHRPHAAWPRDRDESLKDLLHHSPRLFGKPTSLWTLDLVAEVCHGRAWTPRQLTGEAIRVALKRLGIRWRRAKHWITSPDPAYARKKKRATG